MMHDKKSPALHWMGMVVWFITALAAIKVGLRPWGYDLMHSLSNWGMGNLIVPTEYLVGICGVISMILLINCALRCAQGKC
jgi:uncharacterized membrane protein YuzA (DUF378 family)